MTLSVTMFSRHAECHYAGYRALFIVMLSVIMMSVIMMSVIMMSVVMLNVVILSVVGPNQSIWK